MPSRLARAARRHRRAITRRIRRAMRRRLRAIAARRTARRQAVARARAAASPLAPRSITGTPRPVGGQADRLHEVGGPQQHGTGRPAPAARKAAPMNQRVKRTKDGKFNGSTSGGKKTAAKKSAAKKTTATTALTPEARKAAQTARILAAGNKRVARVDKRTDAADARLDRAFGHGRD